MTHMTIFDFTVEETSLIAIYKGGTRMETLILIAAAYPDMGADFNAADFTIPGDEDEGDGFDEDSERDEDGGGDGNA